MSAMKIQQKTIWIILLTSCLLLILVYAAITESYWSLTETKPENKIKESANLLAGKLLLIEGAKANEMLEVANTSLASAKHRGMELEQADTSKYKVHQSLLSNLSSEQSRKLPLFLQDIIPSPDEHNIYQILTTNPGILKMRHYCSLESYCLQNPKSKVWFLMLGLDILDGEAMRVLGNLEESYPNLRLAKIDMNLTVSGTPLEPIVSSGRLKKSAYPANHLSDVIRLAVVAKVGGMYTDFDFICLRSVYKLRNFVAQALSNIVTNAVFHFSMSHPYLKIMMEDDEKNFNRSSIVTNAVFHLSMSHPYLKIMMEDDEKNFNGKQWATNGPLLFTRVVKQYCPDHVTNPTQMNMNLETLMEERSNYLSHLYPGAKNSNESVNSGEAAEGKQPKSEEVELCQSFKLLNTKAFVPLYAGKIAAMFEKDSRNKIQGIPASSYGIHLFNKITSKKTVGENSGMETIMKLNCPRTFATSITEHRGMR